MSSARNSIFYLFLPIKLLFFILSYPPRNTSSEKTMTIAFVQPFSAGCVAIRKRNSFFCPSTRIGRVPSTGRRRSFTTCAAERLEVPAKVRNFAALGSIALTCALINRVFNTPVLTPFQSRADIIAVVCGVSLLVYAAGGTEVKERGTRVAQEGTSTDFQTSLPLGIATEARFIARAAMAAVENITSATVFMGTQCVARAGLYRNGIKSVSDVVAGGAVISTVENGKLSYFADLKVMPTKEIEFAYLPKQCQVRKPVCNRNRDRY